MTESTDAPAASTAKKRGKTGGGLSSMLLADLKSMAGGMGVSGAASMKKAQLVEAIKAAQSGASAGAASAPSTGPSTGPSEVRTPKAAPSKDAQPESGETKPETRPETKPGSGNSVAVPPAAPPPPPLSLIHI